MEDTLRSLGWLVFAVLPLLMVWSLIWKGWALWRAAQNNSKPWFVVLLLVNTLGILEILYIFVFGKEEKQNMSGEMPKKV
ncbi:MAG: hypothetical protein HOA57_02140 [Candidatus Magasanikbacteria bacterium]|jgi:hypothetical protein|nr:hypothetical protein [Candidatus Magasanikbacteria bacterium]MBT4314541.1 hypothetical protein [Candidatus Magasanikbacteria bacterium]MBT4547439.1 hypothetical protein [Candidatus Magasanikbacteria bacterium]MBT6819154.1 hypothetical protein [Candidatus Magasanikbacteria bacterium]